MPEFTEKQELNEGIDWHAICTTAGGVAHERVHLPPAGNGEIRGHVKELFWWWPKKSEK